MSKGDNPNNRFSFNINFQHHYEQARRYAEDSSAFFVTTGASTLLNGPLQILKAQKQMHPDQSLMQAVRHAVRGSSALNVLKVAGYNGLCRSISDGLTMPFGLRINDFMQQYMSSMPAIIATSGVAGVLETAGTLVPEIRQLKHATGRKDEVTPKTWREKISHAKTVVAKDAKNVAGPLLGRNILLWVGFFAAVAVIDHEKQKHGDISLVKETAIGVGSGLVSGMASVPFDAAATRQFAIPNARGMLYALVDLARAQGIRGVFSGGTSRVFQMGFAIGANMIGVHFSSHNAEQPEQNRHQKRHMQEEEPPQKKSQQR